MNNGYYVDVFLSTLGLFCALKSSLIFIFWLQYVGKFILSYVPACGEKEYYIGSACEELYAPPSAYFQLYGLTVQASFLGGELLVLFKENAYFFL